MEEMNTPGEEDARITVPWFALSVMLSGFFSPLPTEVAQHSFTSPVSTTFGGESPFTQLSIPLVNWWKN